MKLKKSLALIVTVVLLIATVSVAASAADLPISIGTPENVTVTQSGAALTVSYEVGESDKSLLKMASNSLILALAGVEKLEVGAQVDYKVDGMTNWLAEDKLISGPCKLNEALSVTVSNPASALVDWNTTTLMVRVRWAGSVKMKGEDAMFVTGDWSDVAYFGKIPAEPTETEPTATEPTATEPTAAEPTETAAETVLLGDANDDGAVNMKDVLTMRKYIASMDTTINLKNADVNCDSSVNLKDVLLVRKQLAGIASL